MTNKNPLGLGDIEFLDRATPDGFPRLWKDIAARLYAFRIKDMLKQQARTELEPYELELVAQQVVKLTQEMQSRLGDEGMDGARLKGGASE